jgi:hypothetical protein
MTDRKEIFKSFGIAVLQNSKLLLLLSRKIFSFFHEHALPHLYRMRAQARFRLKCGSSSRAYLWNFDLELAEESQAWIDQKAYWT